MATKENTENDREVRDLLKVAQPGDMIEFHRGKYSHWAVYVGK